MKLTSFWSDTYPRPANLPVTSQIPEYVDVAIVGGGYTGLSAARILAKSGASVAVLERETIGWGASSRNGGITGGGLKRASQAIFKSYGDTYGHIFWKASLEALDLIKELVNEEGIACDWHQDGELCLAVKPSHFEGFKEEISWSKKNLWHTLTLVSPSELREEIGSEAYSGGLVDPLGAGLHPAKLVFGLARVAAKYGARLHENTSVISIEPGPKGFTVHTDQGHFAAKEVIVATNGYTDKLVPGLRSKVIPVGSYSIVTEPLPSDLVEKLSPKGRMFWDSKWFLNYFRVTPDGRMLWGGRNNLSTNLDLEESARTLRAQMVQAFPQLREVPVTHSWTGQLGLTFDLMPNLGQQHGIHFAFGYGGHGLHTALYLGRELGLILSGQKSSSPFAEIRHQSYFFYRYKPWFMPLAVQYYRVRDRLS
jgi:glycine/D-amino acid oxidase-like deaminating enzyme